MIASKYESTKMTAIDFMTKVLAASDLGIYFELRNRDNECGLKAKIYFCHDSGGLPKNSFLLDGPSDTIVKTGIKFNKAAS